MYYLGIDLGSSSIKVALVEIETGSSLAVIHEPDGEMPIYAQNKGWAEQSPEDWWTHTCNAIGRIMKANQVPKENIGAVGIAYQMHGLVVLDSKGIPLRRSIIWCDSRAVPIGEKAYQELGESYCQEALLNSPANFTASKLKWLQENEPGIYERMATFMLPGDYLAFRLSRELTTTIPGLSEGIFWDYQKGGISRPLFEQYGIDPGLLPEIIPTFSGDLEISEQGAAESGLAAGTPICYRSGDQPNNALSLNVLRAGEVAATGGTSGVMYAITDNPSTKECERVNNFAHVNYSMSNPLIGKLLCINGAGIQYRWLRANLGISTYEEMNNLAAKADTGSDGVCVIPFGNGAERILHNRNVGTRIVNLNLNRHSRAHLCRAALEGIAFSFVYGFEIMKLDGITPCVLRAGNDNLFRSEIFSNTIATLIQQEIEICNTTGAIGAARACSLREGDYQHFASLLSNDHVMNFMPFKNASAYQNAYVHWKRELELILEQ